MPDQGDPAHPVGAKAPTRRCADDDAPPGGVAREALRDHGIELVGYPVNRCPGNA